MIALFFARIFFEASGAIKDGWRWITATPVHLILAAWALTGAVLAYYVHDDHVARREAVLSANALHAAQDASKAELARAQAEFVAAATHEKEMNDATDQNVAASHAADAAGLVGYERTLGMRLAASAYHGGSLPTPSQANLAQGSDRPGATPVLDATLSADLAICTENTRRLVEIHNQAISDSATKVTEQ